MSIELSGDFFERLGKLGSRGFMIRMTNEVGVLAVNFSKDRFQFKNWIDKNGVEKWKPRKRKDRGSLLARSGRLKRSIRKMMTGDYYVSIGTDVPYARMHNEGANINKTVMVKAFKRKRPKPKRRAGRKRKAEKSLSQFVNVRAHKRKMKLNIPQRQFIGDSEFLAKRIEKYINYHIDKELK